MPKTAPIVWPQLQGALDRHRARLPLGAEHHRAMAEACRRIKLTEGLFLLDPRLHPMLSGDWWPWQIPGEADWHTTVVDPSRARSCRAKAGFRSYRGPCVVLSCDYLIHEVLLTFCRHGAGPALDKAFSDAAAIADAQQTFVLAILGGLMDTDADGTYERPEDSGVNAWLLREMAEQHQRQCKGRQSNKIALGAAIAAAMRRAGYDPTDPIADQPELLESWIVRDRIPSRAKAMRRAFRPEVVAHLGRAMNGSLFQTTARGWHHA